MLNASIFNVHRLPGRELIRWGIDPGSFYYNPWGSFVSMLSCEGVKSHPTNAMHICLQLVLLIIISFFTNNTLINFWFPIAQSRLFQCSWIVVEETSTYPNSYLLVYLHNSIEFAFGENVLKCNPFHCGEASAAIGADLPTMFAVDYQQSV